MSDMSSLSHEYASAADFSRHANDAVLLLKKKYLADSDLSAVAPDEFTRATHILKATVQAVLHRFGDSTISVTEGEHPIPEDVLARIELRFRSDWDDTQDDLRRVLGLLETDDELTKDDLDLLDSICEAADASASAMFRKLWRR